MSIEVTASRRMCGSCARIFLGDDRAGTYTCAACAAAQPPFDPTLGSIVHLAAGLAPAWRTYIVIDRRGDTVTVRSFGDPGGARFDVHLTHVTPSRGGSR